MRLLVDDREPTDFIDALVGGYGLPAERKRLEIGDFWFVAEGEDEMPLLIVERKAWADLRSSCSDGRFRSQRARLLEMFPLGDRPVCVLLVESEENQSRVKEDWKHPRFGPLNKRCESELLRATVFHSDGMRLVRTYGHDHTCRALAWIYNELSNASLAATKALESSCDLDVCNRAKKARKESSKKKFEAPAAALLDRRAALLSIKGLSLPRVLAIESSSKSLHEWGSAFLQDKNSTVASLASVKLQNGKKLGNILARRVLDMLTY